jgi:cadmium resistance protein CadD (predicted permease)
LRRTWWFVEYGRKVCASKASLVTVSLLVAAFVAFAATTVDDLIIVTPLFTSSRATGAPRPRSFVAGQYVGFQRGADASV